MTTRGEPPLEADSSNYRKYQTGNPVMRWIIDRFLGEVVDTVAALRPQRIVDLGCGEGIVAGLLAERLPDSGYLGLDVSPEAVEVARRLHPDLEFRVGSVYDPPLDPGGADLVICLEVIEHLDEPEAALGRLLEWTTGSALVSVPWEPWFRLGNLLRGRHVGAWGNHPEHVQQFSPASFTALLAGRAPRVRVRTCFPWLIGQVGPWPA